MSIHGGSPYGIFDGTAQEAEVAFRGALANHDLEGSGGPDTSYNRCESVERRADMPTIVWYWWVLVIVGGVWLVGAVLTWLLFSLTDRGPDGRWDFSRDWGAKLTMALSWFVTFWQWNWPQLIRGLKATR